MATTFKSVCYVAPSMEEYHKAMDPLMEDSKHILTNLLKIYIYAAVCVGVIFISTKYYPLPYWALFLMMLPFIYLFYISGKGAIYFMTKYKSPVDKDASSSIELSDNSITIAGKSYDINSVKNLHITYNSFKSEEPMLQEGKTPLYHNSWGHYKIIDTALDGVDNTLMFDTADGTKSYLFLVKKDAVNDLIDVVRIWQKSGVSFMYERQGCWVPAGSDLVKYVG